MITTAQRATGGDPARTSGCRAGLISPPTPPRLAGGRYARCAADRVCSSEPPSDDNLGGPSRASVVGPGWGESLTRWRSRMRAVLSAPELRPRRLRSTGSSVGISHSVATSSQAIPPRSGRGDDRQVDDNQGGASVGMLPRTDTASPGGVVGSSVVRESVKRGTCEEVR